MNIETSKKYPFASITPFEVICDASINKLYSMPIEILHIILKMSLECENVEAALEKRAKLSLVDRKFYFLCNHLETWNISIKSLNLQINEGLGTEQFENFRTFIISHYLSVKFDSKILINLFKQKDEFYQAPIIYQTVDINKGSYSDACNWWSETLPVQNEHFDELFDRIKLIGNENPIIRLVTLIGCQALAVRFQYRNPSLNEVNLKSNYSWIIFYLISSYKKPIFNAILIKQSNDTSMEIRFCKFIDSRKLLIKFLKKAIISIKCSPTIREKKSKIDTKWIEKEATQLNFDIKRN